MIPNHLISFHSINLPLYHFFFVKQMDMFPSPNPHNLQIFNTCVLGALHTIPAGIQLIWNYIYCWWISIVNMRKFMKTVLETMLDYQHVDCLKVIKGDYRKLYLHMMTSSNGNIFRVIGPLWGSPVNSPHKGQWCGALMICTWTNGWVSNRDAGDLRRYRAHCDVIVMNTDSSGVRDTVTEIASLWLSIHAQNTLLVHLR